MLIIVKIMFCNIISDIACIEVFFSIIIIISNIKKIISFSYIDTPITVNAVMFIETTSEVKL